MTDLEISKALALVIGWPADAVVIFAYETQVRTYKNPLDPARCTWRVFDYTDWNVIGPIAEKFDCFPFKTGNEWWAAIGNSEIAAREDTPQKAIALAVIGSVK